MTSVKYAMPDAPCIPLLYCNFLIGNLEKCGIQDRHEHQGQHGRKSQAEPNGNRHGHKEAVLQQRDHSQMGFHVYPQGRLLIHPYIIFGRIYITPVNGCDIFKVYTESFKA